MEKKLEIWTCDDENATFTKLKILGYIFCSMIFIFMIIMSFFVDLTNDTVFKFDLVSGLIFSIITGWVPVIMILLAKKEYKMIALNKEIPLYLYKIEDFAKLGELPENKFVLFSDEHGIVLAENKYKIESKYCCGCAKYFGQFVELYERETGEVFYENN